ncbi:MAG: DNA polymerase III subunit delta' [Deltaproteobacteria bacterium]|nr:MAG: DNA polymerase III subunit delta' [Deltaproteobacteria bacterium]
MDEVGFRGLLGHERTATVLRRAVAGGRLHHASLFTGPSGVGKRIAARALAALLQCEQRPVSDGLPDACGTCPHCRRVRDGIHPDVIDVSPDGRFIRIEQVRELTASTRFRPYEGRVRVVIVHGAEAMKAESANALLKTLEEPGGETVFILLSDRPHQLLPTIRSRCQPVRFARLDRQTVVDLLRREGVSAAEAEVLAELGDGSVGDALAFRASALADERTALLALLARAPSLGADQCLVEAERLASQRERLESLLLLAQSLYRDALVVHASGGRLDRCINRDALDSVQTLARHRSPAHLHQDAARVREAARQLEGNVNPRLVMESLLIELSRPERRAI